MKDSTRSASPSTWLRILIWGVVLCVLAATFLAYGQIELMIQWVTAVLC